MRRGDHLRADTAQEVDGEDAAGIMDGLGTPCA